MNILPSLAILVCRFKRTGHKTLIQESKKSELSKSTYDSGTSDHRIAMLWMVTLGAHSHLTHVLSCKHKIPSAHVEIHTRCFLTSDLNLNQGRVFTCRLLQYMTMTGSGSVNVCYSA